MARPVRRLELSDQQRSELGRLVARPKASQRMVRRARIVLLRADGLTQAETAATVGVNRPVVCHWEKRFRDGGVEGLHEAQRSGRPPSIPPEVKEEIITEATRPPAGKTQWSTRTMAKAKHVSNQTVHRLWAANDIKPHLRRTFKVSNDPKFLEKFWDVIGLYLDPPERALILCCDEKSQCQALERTQPGLPLGCGDIATKTHDYKRHGTITLFAALNYLDGKIHRRTEVRHTHKEWLAFLKHLDKETPEGVTMHLIMDNYSTHKHEKVMSWINWHNARHRNKQGLDRIALHFTPTSSSWMNLVERFFRDLTVDCIREGSFQSVRELVAAIESDLAERDLAPIRYVWRAEGAEILRKINRARKKLGKEELCIDNYQTAH